VLHGEAVAGEGVGGVFGEDAGEGGELVHGLILVGCRTEGRPRISRIKSNAGEGQDFFLIRADPRSSAVDFAVDLE
jgi:hypothetical protein